MAKNTKNLEVNKVALYSSSKQVEIPATDDAIENEQLKSFLTEKLKSALRAENLLVITGAGSSVDSGGKTMTQLWDSISKDLSDFEAIQDLVSYSSERKEKKDLEHLLSVLQIEKQSLENKGTDNTAISGYIESIESKILSECSFDLPADAPHEFFLRKLLKARKNIDPRIKIFTLNYDRSFETASDRIGAVLIDGFSFSQKQVFNSNSFDLDLVYREKSRIHSEHSFYSKVVHLYKIHGSVTWSKSIEKPGIIQKEKDPVTDAKKSVLIYPNSSKFEKSYEMPFFEMVGRMQSSLRKENSTLLIIGYGFNDEHINRVLAEAIKGNANLEVFVIKPRIDFSHDVLTEYKTWIDSGLQDLHLIGLTFSQFTKTIPEVSFDDDYVREKMVGKSLNES